jgi:hypothetical protein
MALVLKILSGPGAGLLLAVPADFQMTIGRSDDASFSFDDHKLSRKHCAFERVGARVRVTDLESHNGTWVNGQKLEKKPHELEPGDKVKVGSLTLSLIENQSPEAHAPVEAPPAPKAAEVPLVARPAEAPPSLEDEEIPTFGRFATRGPMPVPTVPASPAPAPAAPAPSLEMPAPSSGSLPASELSLVMDAPPFAASPAPAALPPAAPSGPSTQVLTRPPEFGAVQMSPPAHAPPRTAEIPAPNLGSPRTVEMPAPNLDSPRTVEMPAPTLEGPPVGKTMVMNAPVGSVVDAMSAARLGQAHLMAGRVSEARYAFEKAVSAAPGEPIAWLGLARALDQSGDQAGAVRALRQFIQLAPTNPLLAPQVELAQQRLRELGG